MNGKFKVMVVAAALCLALGGLAGCGGGAAQSGSAAGAAGGGAAAASEAATPNFDDVLSGDAQVASSALDGLAYVEVGDPNGGNEIGVWGSSDEWLGLMTDTSSSDAHNNIIARLEKGDAGWHVELGYTWLGGSSNNEEMLKADLAAGEAPEKLCYATYVVDDSFSSKSLAKLVNEVAPFEKGTFFLDESSTYQEFVGLSFGRNCVTQVTADAQPWTVNGKAVYLVSIDIYSNNSEEGEQLIYNYGDIADEVEGYEDASDIYSV